jgi:hypothetical protein
MSSATYIEVQEKVLGQGKELNAVDALCSIIQVSMP